MDERNDDEEKADEEEQEIGKGEGKEREDVEDGEEG